MTKDIEVPVFYPGAPNEMTAGSVTIEFDLYQIDEWHAPSDRFAVVLNGETIYLGEMDSASTSVRLESIDSPPGISWIRTVVDQGQQIGYGAVQDKKFRVALTVDDASLFPANSISLRFQVESTTSTAELTAGVDNLRVSANAIS